MSTFVDTPFERCPLCQEWVFLDQAPEDCAIEREHGCCPLRARLAGQLFVEEDAENSREEGRLRTITQAVVAPPLHGPAGPRRLKAS